MDPAKRALKGDGLAPLTFYQGGGGDSTRLRNIPGHHEAGGDSSQEIAATWRDKRRYGVQIAEAARDQFAATKLNPPPGFTKEITTTQQHEMNLEWWISKREEMRESYEKEREQQIAKNIAARRAGQRPVHHPELQRALSAKIGTSN